MKPAIKNKDTVVSGTKNIEPNIGSIKVHVIIAKKVTLLLFAFW